MTWTPACSPTDIDDWNLCERKWGFRRLTKSYVQNIGAWRGDTGHHMLESWGKDRTPPEKFADTYAIDVAMKFATDLTEKRISATDYVARLVATVNKMTPLLLIHGEPPFPGLEKDFRVKIQGVLWSGRKDLEFAKGTAHPAVIDYKFTSSPEYAKTAAQLPHDPQALTYAFEKFYREPADTVTVKLLYGHIAHKPKAWTVEHTFTPEECVENIAPYTETAKEILQLRLKRPDPLSLTPNWLACPCFGGCSFQDKCKPTPEQLLEAHYHQAMGGLPTKPKKEGSKMEGGLLSTLAGASTPQAPAAAATGQVARSDSSAAIADMQKDAASLLRLGVKRPDVVLNMINRYPGLASVIDMLVPQEPAAPAAVEAKIPDTSFPAGNTVLPSVNSGAPPGVEEKPAAEKPAKAPKATKAKAESGDPLHDLLRALVDETKSSTASLAERADAALKLANAFKLIA